MVFNDPVCQSYSDAKVSSIKNLLYANDAFMLFDASEIESLDANVWNENVYSYDIKNIYIINYTNF